MSYAVILACPCLSGISPLLVIPTLVPALSGIGSESFSLKERFQTSWNDSNSTSRNDRQVFMSLLLYYPQESLKKLIF